VASQACGWGGGEKNGGNNRCGWWGIAKRGYVTYETGGRNEETDYMYR